MKNISAIISKDALFQGIPTVNEMFTVQTTALIQGTGCRESTHPVSGQVQRTLFYAVVNCDSIDINHRRKLRHWFMIKVLKFELRNNDEVVIHHPIGTFPKWEAAIPQPLRLYITQKRMSAEIC